MIESLTSFLNICSLGSRNDISCKLCLGKKETAKASQHEVQTLVM